MMKWKKVSEKRAERAHSQVSCGTIPIGQRKYKRSLAYKSEYTALHSTLSCSSLVKKMTVSAADQMKKHKHMIDGVNNTVILRIDQPIMALVVVRTVVLCNSAMLSNGGRRPARGSSFRTHQP
jgi:hypothetical protein